MGKKPGENETKNSSRVTCQKSNCSNCGIKGGIAFFDALDALSENDLIKTIHIRSEPLLVIDAISRQLAHYPHHIGQILYIGKMLKGTNWKNLSMEKVRVGKST